MQVVTGSREGNTVKSANRDLSPGLALALSLPMLLPTASLANGANGFGPVSLPIATVPIVHAAPSHNALTSAWTTYNSAHGSNASTSTVHVNNKNRLDPLVYQLMNSNIIAFSHSNPLAQTQVVHNLLTRVVPNTQPALASTKAVSVNAFDLDLSSTSDTVVASQIPGFGSGSVTIKVGSQYLSVNGSSYLTQAEASAVYQVLTTGKQTLTIDASGSASGGSLTIAPAYSQSVDGLSIPKGVSVIDESSSNAPLLLSNGLINNGNLYVLSATGSSLPVSISAPTIDNSKGSLISIMLPSTLTGLSGYGNGTDLVITSNSLNNRGSIYAPGNLTLTASTIQNDGTITAHSGNLTVQNNGGNLNVSGVGSFNASRTVLFNVTPSATNASPNLSINGNSIAAKTVDFNDAGGALNVNGGSIAGGINATAATVYINANNSGLNILSMNATGDPTVTSVGNIVLSAGTINTVNQPFTILAGGNITTSDSAKATMDASSLTGAGGDITIEAGVTFTPGTTTVTGKSTTGGSINLPGISLNTNSADITLVAHQGSAAKTGTISILNVTASGAGLGLYHDGGNITITADGNITTSKITSTGLAAASGDGGIVTITSNKGSVTTSDISVNGGSGTPGVKGVSGAGGDGGDGGDGYNGGSLGLNDTIGGTGGYGGAAGMNYGGAGGAGAKNVGDQPGAGLAPTPGKAGTPLGGTGGNGGQALTGAFAGLDGKGGQDGVDGTDASKDGRDGGDAGSVIITAHTSINTGKITAVGGAGGGGGAGGDGGNGGNGGGGGYGGQPAAATGAAASGSPGFAGGNGGDGGTGGGGGDGSDGGNGGNGGIVQLTAGTTITSKGIDVSGGAGGSGGKGGKGGDGGYGGNGGDGGNGGAGGPDSLSWFYGYDYVVDAYTATLEYQSTSNSGDGGAGGAGGNGGAAGDGGDGGSGGKGGIGGNAGSIVLNAGSTVSVTSIARAGGAGGNGGAAGQGGQFGKGGDGGAGGDGGGTSFNVYPSGSPGSPLSSMNGFPVTNAGSLPGNPPYSSNFAFNFNGNIQGAGGAGGAGGDGGSGANNQPAQSGNGGSGGDAGIGGLSGNLTITAAKTPTIGSQIFFNGPSGVAGAGASFGMAPPANANPNPTTPPPPVFTQTGKAGTGGNGVATSPFIPLLPNPNPGSTAKAADGQAGMAGQNGDYGDNGSSPTPRGGSGTTSIKVGGNTIKVTIPKVSVNPPLKTPPIITTWQSTGQGNAVLLFSDLAHTNPTQNDSAQTSSQSSVHSNFARALAEIANTEDSLGTTSSVANLSINSNSTLGSVNPDLAITTLINSPPSLVSPQTLAGISNVNAESLPRLAFLPSTSTMFKLGVGVQDGSQGLTETRQIFRPKDDVTLQFGDTEISMHKNAVAFIVRNGKEVSIYNLGDGKKGEIAVRVNGHQLELGIGQQAVISSRKINDFVEANLDQDIAWRAPRVQVLPDGKRVFAVNFSIVSAMQKLYAGKGQVANLEALDARAAGKMLKNAAILASLTGADYVQTTR